MILSSRPHRLVRLSDDTNLSCSAVPKSGEGAVVRFPDGTTRIYGYAVYLESDSPDFSTGEWVRLMLDGQSLELEVLGVMRYQTYLKLWL